MHHKSIICCAPCCKCTQTLSNIHPTPADLKSCTLHTFAKGDRIKASPPGDEPEMFDPGVDDTPRFAIDVVWKLSISCDMTFRWASSLKKRKYGRTDNGTWFAAMVHNLIKAHCHRLLSEGQQTTALLVVMEAPIATLIDTVRFSAKPAVRFTCSPSCMRVPWRLVSRTA